MDSQKIKVYSLSSTYPDSPNSIIHFFVHTINKELAKLNVSVKVITPHSKGALTKELMDNVLIKRFRYFPEKYEIKLISIAEVVNESKGGFFKVVILTLNFFIFTFFECLKEKPDILHGHWALPGGFIAIVMSKIFRKKSVVTLHGGIALLKKFKFLRKIVIRNLNQASLIITNSNYTKTKFIEMGVKKDKITRVFVPPNFVDFETDNQSINQYRNSITEPSTKIILVIGRFVEYKGIEYLIRSLLKIEKVKVHLIVAGYGLLLKNLQDLTKSLGLENKVTFIVGPSHQKLGLIHSMSNVFVLPSIVDSGGETEGLGMVILEAMKSGLPVIASSVGGISEIIEHEVNGLLVKPKDPISIANAVEKVLSEKELERKIILNANETLKNFMPAKLGREHLEIYQNLIKK